MIFMQLHGSLRKTSLSKYIDKDQTGQSAFGELYNNRIAFAVQFRNQNNESDFMVWVQSVFTVLYS